MIIITTVREETGVRDFRDGWLFRRSGKAIESSTRIRSPHCPVFSFFLSARENQVMPNPLRVLGRLKTVYEGEEGGRGRGLAGVGEG